MMRPETLIFVLVCRFGISIQSCEECACCNGVNSCGSNKNCKNGCMAGNYGEKCINECPRNCKTCKSDTECTECKRCNTCSPGTYGQYCELNCTKKCFSCFSKTNCTKCKEGLYGDTCTQPCPSGCKGNCSIADGRCLDCKTGFAGEFCNYTCLEGTFGNNCSRLCHEVDRNCRVCFTDELGEYGDCAQCNSGHYPVIPFGLNHSICKSCPINCKDRECNITGFCSNGCVRGKWGQHCNKNCSLNCEECRQRDGKCLECTNETFSGNCSQNCSTNCNMTGSGRICDGDTGKCLHGCIELTNYGDFCEKQCNDNCIIKRCDWITGQCLFGCKDGLYGDRCENNCSSRCINITCNKITGECLHGCMDGFERVKCVQVIKGSESENKLTVIIAASAGAGVAFIILVLSLAICLIRRKRKQRLPSDQKCEENDYIQDMEDIWKQNDDTETEADVTNAHSFKSKRTRIDGAVKEYDTALDNEISITDTNTAYAVVNKGNSVKQKNDCVEVVYDTTNGNKKKRPIVSNNEYAVLSLKSSLPVGIDKLKRSQPWDGHDTYDTTKANKSKNILNLDNEYASINNKRDILKTDTTSPLYDTTLNV